MVDLHNQMCVCVFTCVCVCMEGEGSGCGCIYLQYTPYNILHVVLRWFVCYSFVILIMSAEKTRDIVKRHVFDGQILLTLPIRVIAMAMP